MSLRGHMSGNRSLWRLFAGPLLLLGAAAAGVATANSLDQPGPENENQRELSLLIGVASLFVLLPSGVAWLIIAIVVWRAREGRS